MSLKRSSSTSIRSDRRDRSSRRHDTPFQSSKSSKSNDTTKSRCRSRSSSRSRVESKKIDHHTRKIRSEDKLLKENRCLGIFGLTAFTTEQELYDIFSKIGPLERIHIISDPESGKSRGFGFIYFENLDDAKLVKEQCEGMLINNRCIRLEYSRTAMSSYRFSRRSYESRRSYDRNDVSRYSSSSSRRGYHETCKSHSRYSR